LTEFALEKEDTTSIQIPNSLYRKLEEKIKGTSFVSVSSYVTFLIRETMAETEQRQKEPFSKEEEEKVKDRLRALGYIE
jgi:Arc/MetJ-type ribon-helix-helix transcriptional regulator